ncbi:MAG: hypothetical protein KA885_08185, partial [Spirochaetes bacterium]|nr:hypothetical protein [Spirochaetota bacterium]
MFENIDLISIKQIREEQERILKNIISQFIDNNNISRPFSLIELDLTESDKLKIHNFFRSFIETEFMDKYREEMQDYLHQNRYAKSLADMAELIPSSYFGILFLLHVTFLLNQYIKQANLWDSIYQNSDDYVEFIKIFFVTNLDGTIKEYPGNYLKTCINLAISEYDLRNYEIESYKSVIMQIGLTNEPERIVKWLFYKNPPLVIKELLNNYSSNYSRIFEDGWNKLNSYKKGLITRNNVLICLMRNPFFKFVNLQNLLNSIDIFNNIYNQRNNDNYSYSDVMLLEENAEDKNHFYIEKIGFEQNNLFFIIGIKNIEDIELKNNLYNIIAQNSYKARLVRQEDNSFTSNGIIKINVDNSYELNISLVEVKSSEIVYSEKLNFLDLFEVFLIFQENSEIIRDSNFKLKPEVIYNIMYHPNVSSNADNNLVYNLFNGALKLVRNINTIEDFKLYDTQSNEIIYNSNPVAVEDFNDDLFDNLFIFGKSETEIIINNELTFSLKSLSDGNNLLNRELRDIPDDCMIISWICNNNRGIVNQTEKSTSFILTPNIIINNKHKLVFKYKNKIITRTIKSYLFDFSTKIRVIGKKTNSECGIILSDRDNKIDLITINELLQYDFYLVNFSLRIYRDNYFIKDKNRVIKMLDFRTKDYKNKIIFNSKFRFKEVLGYGESLDYSNYFYSLTEFNNSFSREFIKKIIDNGIILDFNENNTNISISIINGYNDLTGFNFRIIDNNLNIKTYKMNDFQDKKETNKFNIPKNICHNDFILILVTSINNYCIGSIFKNESNTLININNIHGITLQNYIKFIRACKLPLLYSELKRIFITLV